MNLRNAARGRICQVRTDVCSYDPEKTVLCHVRISGISGMGIKAPDLLGAHACFECHELCDTGKHGKTKLERDERERIFLIGVIRTQALLISEGIVKW